MEATQNSALPSKAEFFSELDSVCNTSAAPCGQDPDCAICMAPLDVDLTNPPVDTASTEGSPNHDSHHPVLLSCNHSFGFTCIRTWLETNNTCPMCRHPQYRAGPGPDDESGWESDDDDLESLENIGDLLQDSLETVDLDESVVLQYNARQLIAARYDDYAAGRVYIDPTSYRAFPQPQFEFSEPLYGADDIRTVQHDLVDSLWHAYLALLMGNFGTDLPTVSAHPLATRAFQEIANALETCWGLECTTTTLRTKIESHLHNHLAPFLANEVPASQILDGMDLYTSTLIDMVLRAFDGQKLLSRDGTVVEAGDCFPGRPA